MKAVKMIAWILLIIGGLNWGLVGLFEFDLVASIFGSSSVVSKIVYILVGISALLAIFGKGKCKSCNSGESQM